MTVFVEGRHALGHNLGHNFRDQSASRFPQLRLLVRNQPPGTFGEALSAHYKQGSIVDGALSKIARQELKAKGSVFGRLSTKSANFAHEIVERLPPRVGHAQAIGAITHRLCRLTACTLGRNSWRSARRRRRCERAR